MQIYLNRKLKRGKGVRLSVSRHSQYRKPKITWKGEKVIKMSMINLGKGKHSIQILLVSEDDDSSELEKITSLLLETLSKTTDHALETIVKEMRIYSDLQKDTTSLKTLSNF